MRQQQANACAVDVFEWWYDCLRDVFGMHHTMNVVFVMRLQPVVYMYDNTRRFVLSTTNVFFLGFIF